MTAVIGRWRLFPLIAVLALAVAGCGYGEFNIKFVPDEESLKGQPPIPIYVYFAPPDHVSVFKELTSEAMFESDSHEKRMTPQMLKSTVVSSEKDSIVTAKNLPKEVAKIFIWGNFSAGSDKTDTRLSLDSHQFEKSMLSTVGSLEIPVRRQGFGPPR